ncbi:hypothetical protein M0R45_007377 [Rubus argutus]|uniref:PI4-kinase N-terminal domain-containing protein n=1 Tax=Rubus argutus TaxID=59490 RepID=A0AAW1Y056_RUBAR
MEVSGSLPSVRWWNLTVRDERLSQLRSSAHPNPRNLVGPNNLLHRCGAFTFKVILQLVVLYFYVALFGLTPPIQKVQQPLKQASTTLNSVGSMGTIPLQALGIHNGLLLFSELHKELLHFSVKWLEDELELNALHNPGSHRGNANEKAALAQRAARSTALGGRVDVASMTTISGVKATYLLAVAFMEIIRFSSNGGILNGDSSLTASRSAFSCVFEYLKTPNLMPAVFQCLMATVHRAFETVVLWLEDRISETGNEAEVRESTLFAHACFLIKSMSQREEPIQEVAVNLVTQLRDKFPQILWNSSCVDYLLFSIHNDSPSIVVNDPAWVVTVCFLYTKRLFESGSLNRFHMLLVLARVFHRKSFVKQTCGKEHSIHLMWFLFYLRYGLAQVKLIAEWHTNSKHSCSYGCRSRCFRRQLKITRGIQFGSAQYWYNQCNNEVHQSGEIAGMRRLYNSMGGFQSGTAPTIFGLGMGLQRLISGAFPQQTQAQDDQFNGMFAHKVCSLLQQFVNAAEKGWEVDKSQFCETCSQATALLLSNLGSNSKSNVEGFSQLLRLLCWCPA